MQESVRRHYLALLGIEQWLPRGEADPVAAAGPVAVGVPLAAAPGPASLPAATATLATAAPAGIEREPVVAGATTSTERREVPVGSAAKLDALMQQSGAPTPRQTRAPASPAASGAQPTAPAPVVSAVATERLACSLLVSDDGLLVVAAFATMDAPGLSAAEHEMLLRLAGALSPRFTAMPVDLHWPPRGARVPGLDRPGAARQALQEALVTRQRQGVRDLLLLGEEMAPLLADAVTRLGLTLVVAPALAAMLADPQAKRACWDLAKSLRRAP